MDNIIFKKIWQDGNLIELKVSVTSEFVSIYQRCYVQDKALYEISEKIDNYVKRNDEFCYLEFGKKDGNYTPAFFMDIFPADKLGHLKIEVDVEIEDNETRSHRCRFYLKSELGLLEKLGVLLKNMIKI